MHAPSHYTPKMARNVLSPWYSKSWVYDQISEGGQLEPEYHHGDRLIPAYRVIAIRNRCLEVYGTGRYKTNNG